MEIVPTRNKISNLRSWCFENCPLSVWSHSVDLISPIKQLGSSRIKDGAGRSWSNSDKKLTSSHFRVDKSILDVTSHCLSHCVRSPFDIDDGDGCLTKSSFFSSFLSCQQNNLDGETSEREWSTRAVKIRTGWAFKHFFWYQVTRTCH